MTIAVQIAESRSDRVTVIAKRVVGFATKCEREIRTTAVIDPEQVALQAVVGDINVNVSILVKIGGRDTPRA